MALQAPKKCDVVVCMYFCIVSSIRSLPCVAPQAPKNIPSTPFIENVGCMTTLAILIHEAGCPRTDWSAIDPPGKIPEQATNYNSRTRASTVFQGTDSQNGNSLLLHGILVLIN